MSDNKPINIRLTLLEVRFPTLHAEAQRKISGGVKSSDVLADWLNELICLRGERIVAPETPKNDDLDDIARSAMQGLLG